MGYSLHWERNGVVKKYFGHVTSSELLEPVVLTEADERFDSLRYVINDFLDVQDMSCSQSDIDDIAAQDLGAATINPHVRIAMVTREPEIIDSIGRYVRASGEVFPTRVFLTVAEARAWLQAASA